MTRVEARDALLVHMATLSENYWCASWLDGLDEYLREMVERDEPGPFGIGNMDREDFELLRDLHAGARGWWAWKEGADPGGVMFVPDAGTDEPGIDAFVMSW